MMKNGTVLIIGFTWPEPSASAAGARMLQLILFFLGQGCQVTFSSTAKETDLSIDLKGLGVTKVPIKLNDPRFDSFIVDLSPELVLFDRYLMEEQFGWRVAEYAPMALRVLDTEDLHSLRYAREKALTSNEPFTAMGWLQHDITKRELASIYRCDLSLIISTFEMHLLQTVLNLDGALLLHLPFMVEEISEETAKDWLPFKAREHFVFIGTGKHTPNLDAIFWLKQEIWPMIRKILPQTELHVYGTYLPQQIMQLHCPKEGFHIDGQVENAKEVIGRSRISLAPLRFGAGLKGKLVDAMICGTPNVTTTIGAEGMHGKLSWNGAVADSAADFAQAAVSLHNNRTEWEKAQKNGVAIINTLYGATFLKAALAKKIQSIYHDLEQHRTNNFMGAMLQHHTMASTKYMSKWIMAKNLLNHKKNDPIS